MEQTLQSLHKQYRTFRRLAAAELGLLVLALAAVFYNKGAAFALLGVAVVFRLAVLRRRQRAYVSGVTRANLQATLCPALGAEAPDETGGGAITPATLEQARLIPFEAEPGGCLLRQGICGERDGLAVAVCDATLGQRFELVENGRKRVHFMSGVWLHITLPRDTGMDWRLLDRDALPQPIRRKFYGGLSGMERQELGGRWKESGLLFYTRVDSPSCPGDRVLNQVRSLMQYTPGKLALSLRGDRLDLFLRERLLALPVTVRKAPARERLVFDPLPELAYAMRIANVISEVSADSMGGKE